MLKNALSWKSTPRLVVTVLTNISCAPGTFLPSAHGLRVREENSVEFGENWISFLQNFNVLPQVGSLKAIPAHLDVLYQKALEEGYQKYVKSGRFNGFWREIKVHRYKDKYKNFLTVVMMIIRDLQNLTHRIVSNKLLVCCQNWFNMRITGSWNSWKREEWVPDIRVETKRLFLPRPVSFLLPKYTSEFTLC